MAVRANIPMTMHLVEQSDDLFDPFDVGATSYNYVTTEKPSSYQILQSTNPEPENTNI